MCGICGAVDPQRGRPLDGVVRRMTAALVHRGPDEEGYFSGAGVSLGMRRLSIIDLQGGSQPIYNEDETVALVLNGEIYNFKELRGDLERRGHRFRSHCDTEAVVHAYEEWGPECVHRLRGMFAFAVWDGRPVSGGPSLFLARDRIGIKPLYYSTRNGTFLFASEVRALLASRLVPRRLSPAALEGYLSFGSVAEPMTLVEGVVSLPPGCRLTVRPAETASPSVPEPYWELGRLEGAGVPAPEDGPPLEKLHAAVEDAVRSHLVADVPVGVFLSGGIDSAVVAAFAARHRADLRTFTVAFPDEPEDESEAARRTARALGSRHVEAHLSEADILAGWEGALSAMDQPTMDGVNTYFVSKAARGAGLKVALSGLGGDELFGGYATFRWAPFLRWAAGAARRLPASVREVLLPFPADERLSDSWRKLAALWRRPDAFPHPYFFHRLLFTPGQSERLLRDPVGAALNSLWRSRLEASALKVRGLDDFSAVSFLEQSNYLVNTLLRDADAMSMAHSLEVRVPYLDHNLVEFAFREREFFRRAGGGPKAVLRDILGRVLPAEAHTRRKHPFHLPWGSWLKGPLGRTVAAGLSRLSPALRPFLSERETLNVWRSFERGRTNWSRPWSLFVLNEWAKKHLEKPPAETGEESLESAYVHSGA